MRLDDRIESIYNELLWRGLATEKKDWLHRQQGMAMERAKVLEDLADSIVAVVASTKEAAGFKSERTAPAFKAMAGKVWAYSGQLNNCDIVPSGAGDVAWCAHADKVVVLEWLDGEPECPECRHLEFEFETHEFIAHVKKP